MIKPYLLFAGDNYYPSGFGDYQGDFATYAEAAKRGSAQYQNYGVDRREFDWYEIVYHPTMKRVYGEVSIESS